MLTDRLFRQAGRTPAATFVESPAGGLSYGDAARLVAGAALVLRTAGVAPGDRIGLLCGNRPAFLVAWMATNDVGATLVPLDPEQTADTNGRLLQRTGARVLLVDPDLELASGGLSQRVEGLRIVPLDRAFEDPAAGAVERQPVAVTASQPSTILFTSGTTGTPKGVVIPHGSYDAAGRDMAAGLSLSTADRFLVFLPLHHANPQMYAVASTIEVGATLVLLPRFSASTFFDDASASGATGFTYVGTVLSILTRRYPGPFIDHPLRWCVGGGAPAPVWEHVESCFGIAVRELYGMTETGGWVTMNVAGATRLGSVGRARPGIDVAVIGADGSEASAGQPGEIVARAQEPSTFFSEYWGDEAATAATLRDGWLHSGDLGHLDADGYLTFTGRSKDLIRRNGEMISPIEIEQALLENPEVHECVVAGIEDDVRGEEILAALVCQGSVDAAEIVARLHGRLTPNLHPRYVLVVDALPKTETQKIKRFEVAAMVDRAIDLHRSRSPETR